MNNLDTTLQRLIVTVHGLRLAIQALAEQADPPALARAQASLETRLAAHTQGMEPDLLSDMQAVARSALAP